MHPFRHSLDEIRRWLLGAAPSGPKAVNPVPRPATPICVVGDIHGRDDLLDQMLDKIAAQPLAANARVVFVGDLIDRGPGSAQVLARIRALCTEQPHRFFCLMGNHERMMLSFLDNPAGKASRWLRVGGVETLQSFGIGHISGVDATDRFTALAQALRAAMAEGLLQWIADLPKFWQSDGLAVVHADADPAVPMAAQSDKHLLWGVRIASGPRADGLWLAHGHVIKPEAKIEAGRISVDTGAWRTGRLSAVWLDRDGAKVLVAQIKASPP